MGPTKYIYTLYTISNRIKIFGAIPYIQFPEESLIQSYHMIQSWLTQFGLFPVPSPTQTKSKCWKGNKNIVKNMNALHTSITVQSTPCTKSYLQYKLFNPGN